MYDMLLRDAEWCCHSTLAVCVQSIAICYEAKSAACQLLSLISKFNVGDAANRPPAEHDNVQCMQEGPALRGAVVVVGRDRAERPPSRRDHVQ